MSYVLQAAVINLAPLLFTIMQKTYGVSLAELASLVLVMFVTQIATDMVAVKLVVTVGYRASVLIACLLDAIGMTLMAILPQMLENAFAGLAVSIIIMSVGAGLTDCIVSPLVDSISVNAKASHMSLLHSCYSWGHLIVILLTTGALALIGRENWFFLPLGWAVFAVITLLFFAVVPMVETEKSEKGSSPMQLLRSGRFILFALIMLCGGASEQIIAQWSSLFAETGLGVSKTVGDLLGPCLFALFMAIGRTGYGVIGEKLNIEKALIVSLFFTVATYLLTVFGGVPMLSLAGCALAGFGVSLLWPGTVSMTAAKIPGGTAMFGLLALAGDTGCSVGPWLTGIISDSVISSEYGASLASKIGMPIDELGLKCGILAGALFPAAMLIMIFVSKKVTKKAKNSVIRP